MAKSEESYKKLSYCKIDREREKDSGSLNCKRENEERERTITVKQAFLGPYNQLECRIIPEIPSNAPIRVCE